MGPGGTSQIKQLSDDVVGYLAGEIPDKWIQKEGFFSGDDDVDIVTTYNDTETRQKSEIIELFKKAIAKLRRR